MNSDPQVFRGNSKFEWCIHN